ncbi:hypothetical protein [Mucilaginibacter aquaedulcis]|jgi:hypothetical protein|uniref:hypothetical protein n=1 Tax=Mucilaginibacter aquaedulcis TaxID=1187081 RepID=UPI0025B5370F|nr:hypothetical protein [Mucilaginibacter aquaedulcis]MDN3548082.1 hypothetical protein [Mucilaginibacter aquaedulcis]
MIRIVSHSIKKENGANINVIIEPVLSQAVNNELNFTGVYTLYKDSEKKGTDLLDIQEIAPEIGESKPLIDDKYNPGFLGRITFENDDSEWHYSGGKLPPFEQEQIVAFIKNSK